MKYKYTRKEFLKKVGFLFSKGKILVPNEVDGEELMKLLLAQKEDKKEWKPCDCPKGGIDGDGMVCDKCGGTEWVKVKSTPSPLEIEEIEEYIFETSYDRKIFNKLIRNQKKLYQLIKEKL